MKYAMPLLLCICFGLTLHQAHVWRSEVSFWKHGVSVSYRAPGPHVALGLAYQHQKRYEEAAGEYFLALDMARLSGVEHDYELGIGINVAKLLSEEHQPAQALDVLNSLIAQFPDSKDALIDIKTGILFKAGVSCRTIRLLGMSCVTS